MKFIENIVTLIFRVLALTMFRQEWAATETDTEVKEAVNNDIEKGYEYDELPSTITSEEEKQAFAKEHGLTYRKPEDKPKPEPEPKQPDEPAKQKPVSKDEPEVVEVKASEKLTLKKAEELLKDYEDDEEVEIQGEKFTKKDFLAKFKEAEKPEADKTHTIGKETLNKKQYDELLADYMKKYELTEDDIKSTPAKVLEKQLDTFGKLENRSKDLHKESQEAAKIRRDLAAEADKLENQWKSVEDKQKADENKKKELEALIAKNPAKEYEDIDDEDDRKDKISELRVDQKLAKRELEQVEESLKTNKKTLDSLDLRSRQLFYHSSYVEIKNNIPELYLNESPLRILNNKKIEDYEKTQLADIVDSLIKGYYVYMQENPESEWTVEDFYKVKKRQYNPEGITASVKPKVNGKEEHIEEKKKKRLLRLIADQKDMPFTIKPGGGDPTAGKSKEAERVKKVLQDTGYGVDHSKFVS